MVENTLGDRIKLLRKQQRMTQVNFAQNLGISQANLSEIESGKSKPSIEVLIAMVIFYKVDLHRLLLSENLLFKKEMGADESELINSYRQLQDIAKEEVLDYLKLKLLRYKK